MSMQRPKKVEEAIAGLHDFDTVSWYQDWFNTVYDYIESLEKTQQCFDKILEYMNDDSISWRDISDDIINEILKEHGFKAT